ncbi:MAG: ribosome small subunit-dependent GTPase A [Clostridia bacterium]|nr:ribosome small subunit-dependent GTPase A [Clostridia bacterium]
MCTRMINGTIIKGVGGLYSVNSPQGVFSCKARGIFRKDSFKPMIGDRVILDEINFDEMTAVIDKIEPRRNYLIRPAVANVDRVVLVIASMAPAPDLLLVDKMIAAARMKNIDVILVVNKIDQNSSYAEKIYRAYKSCTEGCILTCAEDGSGVDILSDFISSGISVLAGQSGAGKSTLSKIILGDTGLKTGELSRKTERGRHTTRHSEMFKVKGFEDAYVIDSPGFSLFDLFGVESGELQMLYPEITSCDGSCRFMDCTHTGEPDCAVYEIVKNGVFDNGRYERYTALYKELKEKERNKYK